MKALKSIHKSSHLIAVATTLCAALLSTPAMAVDAVGGSATNANINVGAGWTILTQVNFSNPGKRYCIANGSADVSNPYYNGANRAVFTVSNTANPPMDQGQERTLEFLNQVVGNIPVRDNSIKEITTTGGWMANVMANPGYFTMDPVPLLQNRTIYFLAKRTLGPLMTVADASLTVVCTDSKLGPALVLPPFPL